MLRLRTLAILATLLPGALPVCAQDVVDQFLPEIDVFYRISPHFGTFLQVKETRENGEGVRLEIGPSVSWFFKPWPRTSPAILQKDVVFSIGYRYLPAPDTPPINRLEPVLLFHFPLWRRIVLNDRNRADLDWQSDSFHWQYRNLIGLERPLDIRNYHPVPIVSAEFFYSNKYNKWSDTALYAGCQFPIHKRATLVPYYEHQNFTGKSPNQQFNQFGLVFNLLY